MKTLNKKEKRNLSQQELLDDMERELVYLKKLYKYTLDVIQDRINDLRSKFNVSG